MPFWQLVVPTSAETSDALTNFLWEQGALGVVEEESPGEPPRLRAFFAATASSTELRRAVNTYRASLRALGWTLQSFEPEITALHDGDWASAWQQAFPPLHVGDRLLVVPPWEANDTPIDSRIQLVIEPARAFGTGHHGSTEGCLRLLEETLELLETGASRMLDLGTGTGILAIAAVKLGVPAVLAVDVDPDAIAAARVNAERNACAERITLALGGTETAAAMAPFPLVVANLLSHTHLALLPQYAGLMARDGFLVLGGILAEEAPRLTSAFEAAWFRLSARLSIDGWATLRFASPRPS